MVVRATSMHTVMLMPKLMLENTAPGVAHTMALQFSRVVGKTTFLYTVMFTPKLGLENMDPGMAHTMALQFSRLVGMTIFPMTSSGVRTVPAWEASARGNLWWIRSTCCCSWSCRL